MSNITKLSIALTPKMARLVRRAVETGEYASSSEVIREALREWRLRRSLSPQDRRGLMRLWREGVEAGPSELLDVDAIKREGRKRLAARGGKRRA